MTDSNEENENDKQTPDSEIITWGDLKRLEESAEAGDLEAQKRLAKMKGVESYEEYKALNQRILKDIQITIDPALQSWMQEIKNRLSPDIERVSKMLLDTSQPLIADMFKELPPFDNILNRSTQGLDWRPPEDRLANHIAENNRLIAESNRLQRELLDKDRKRPKFSLTAKPERPTRPNRGDNIEVWLDWYHAMTSTGYKMTFRLLAQESGYSANTFKQAHRRYKLERGID